MTLFSILFSKNLKNIPFASLYRCRSGSNSQNWTCNNKLVPNRIGVHQGWILSPCWTGSSLLNQLTCFRPITCCSEPFVNSFHLFTFNISYIRKYLMTSLSPSQVRRKNFLQSHILLYFSTQNCGYTIVSYLKICVSNKNYLLEDGFLLIHHYIPITLYYDVQCRKKIHASRYKLNPRVVN